MGVERMECDLLQWMKTPSAIEPRSYCVNMFDRAFLGILFALLSTQFVFVVVITLLARLWRNI